MIKNSLVALAFCALAFGATAQMNEVSAPRDSWLTKCLASEGTFILESKDSVIWGCAPIYDDEGRVHVYYSTWQNDGSWLVDSEIAHAVADHPEGPYRTLGTILDGREGKWDRHTIHNPSVYRIDGKYVLLYIGNDTLQQEPRWQDNGRVAENKQCVGMAISDSPYGPWERFDEPVVSFSPDSDNAWDSYCAVNPTMLKHPNGEYWLYYRSWDRHNDDRRKTGLAIAKNLEGPYVKYGDKALIDHPEMKGQTEDPYVFYYNEKFYCLIRDMGNYDWLSSFLLESDDGINWGEYQRSHHKGDHYYPVSEKSRCERVQVLWRNGEPEYLFNALQRFDGYRSGGALRINMPHIENKLPPAPYGFEWSLNEELSDEFNGELLDNTKWSQEISRCKSVEFDDDNVSVGDGNLNLSISTYGEGRERVYAGSSIVSRSAAKYGYYECRMKCASPTDIVANFILRSGGEADYQELSIAEVLGQVKNKWHVTAAISTSGKVCVSRGQAAISPSADEEYHTYGCWWQSSSRMLFYLDGEYQFTIDASEGLGGNSFTESMSLQLFSSALIQATFDQPIENTNNTTLFDWVRSYELIPTK
ncbi:MAG: family 16 glycosylhydrolase [Rikenellaceae bacterium]